MLAILSTGLLNPLSAPSQLPLCHGDKTCEWGISDRTVLCHLRELSEQPGSETMTRTTNVFIRVQQFRRLAPNLIWFRAVFCISNILSLLTQCCCSCKRAVWSEQHWVCHPSKCCQEEHIKLIAVITYSLSSFGRLSTLKIITRFHPELTYRSISMYSCRHNCWIWQPEGHRVTLCTRSSCCCCCCLRTLQTIILLLLFKKIN